MTSSPCFPIHRRGNFVLGRELHGIEHSQHFVEITPGAHGIAELQLDLLVRTHHEYRAHGGIVRRGAAFGGVPALGRQHAIELGNLKFRVADHRIVHLVALGLLDVRRPLAVTAHRVHAQPDNFRVALGEFRLQPGRSRLLIRTFIGTEGASAGTPSTHGAFVEKPQLNWTTAKWAFPAAWLPLILAAGIVVVPSGMGGIRVSQTAGTRPGTLYPGVHFIVPLLDSVVLYDIRDQVLTTSSGKDGLESTSEAEAEKREAKNKKADAFTVQSRKG